MCSPSQEDNVYTQNVWKSSSDTLTNDACATTWTTLRRMTLSLKEWQDSKSSSAFSRPQGEID